MIKTIGVLSCLFYMLLINAQEPVTDNVQRNYMLLKFGIALNSARSEQISGDTKIKTPVGIGFNYIGFGYHINFHKNVGFKLGLDIGEQSASFKNVYLKEDNQIKYQRESIHTLGIEFQYHFTTKFKFKKDFFFIAETGVDFRSYINSTLTSGTIIYSPDDEEFNIEIKYGSSVNLTPSLPFSIGFMKHLTNGRLFQFQLITSISFIRVVEGTYNYTVNSNIESSGKLYSNGTYYGIELGYAFAKRKK